MGPVNGLLGGIASPHQIYMEEIQRNQALAQMAQIYGGLPSLSSMPAELASEHNTVLLLLDKPS